MDPNSVVLLVRALPGFMVTPTQDNYEPIQTRDAAVRRIDTDKQRVTDDMTFADTTCEYIELASALLAALPYGCDALDAGRLSFGNAASPRLWTSPSNANALLWDLFTKAGTSNTTEPQPAMPALPSPDAGWTRWLKYTRGIGRIIGYRLAQLQLNDPMGAGMDTLPDLCRYARRP